MLLVIASASAQTLSVAPVEAETDDQTELVVSMAGATGMTALQFTLSMPEGVSLSDAANCGATLGDAANGHTLRVEELASGDKLFILYNMDLNTFTDGELLRLPLTAGSEPATGTGKLSTVRTATTASVSHTCDDVNFTVTVSENMETVLQRAYDDAMASITDGNYYQVFTVVGGTNYYLTANGTLTANADEAHAFHFTAVNYNGTRYETGWNLGVAFTNPSLSGGSTGDIVNSGAIRTDNGNNRDDWERQVFFLKDGMYAVRSTNANSTNGGAETYWDMTGTTEQPEAGYNLTPQFIWQLNDLTGAAILAEARAIVEAKEGVGDGLFLIPEDALATLADAVDAAAAVIESNTSTSAAKAQAIDNLRAALDTYRNSTTQPDAGTFYTFQQKASGLFMGLTESGITIVAEENASPLSFIPGDNGGYYLKTDDDLYVGFAGSNNWTMSTSADKKYEWLVSYVGDNYYKITKPNNANHHVGTNDGATSEGSTCYADKNNGDYFLWRIAEYIPVPEIAISEDETTDLTATEGCRVTLTRTIKASTASQMSYNTLVLPFALSQEQIQSAFGNDAVVYAYDGDVNNSVRFSTATAIQANKPVLLTTSTASTNEPYVFEGVDVESTAGGAVAKGTDIDFVGTYAASTSLVGKYFISGDMIYEGTADSKPMQGTRAYFQPNSGSVNALSLVIDGIDITAIQGIDGTITAPKVIYNLQGQRVASPVKGGIYIIDGKKVRL